MGFPGFARIGEGYATAAAGRAAVGGSGDGLLDVGCFVGKVGIRHDGKEDLRRLEEGINR